MDKNGSTNSIGKTNEGLVAEMRAHQTRPQGSKEEHQEKGPKAQANIGCLRYPEESQAFQAIWSAQAAKGHPPNPLEPQIP